MLERLGPIAGEPRYKRRFTHSPNVTGIDFPHVIVWDESQRYYVPHDSVISPVNGEVLDHFLTFNDKGEEVHMFARQFDTTLFLLDTQLVREVTQYPGKGNDQSFWLDLI